MSLEQEKTKNDRAWEFLFEKYNILEEISKNGYFEITSNRINEVRESRLMAKFDHYINLPKIFRHNKLSILPISRSKYKIGYFDTHMNVKYSNSIDDNSIMFPVGIESIDYTNLYSESVALNCAFNTGMIDLLVGEATRHTISGRMSTGSFEFKIKNKIDAFSDYQLCVENSQCEIDGGFESQNYILLIEAKNYLVDDFLVRQLYYPYRLWTTKISKKVLPILMTYSNDRFSFFVYEFKDELNYNSITLVEQKNYVIAPEQIQLDDVSNVFEKIQFVSEPVAIPFPQADRFERVVDLLSLLAARDLTQEEITENYQFNIRQTRYYTDACRYLGLVNKYSDPTTNEITFCLSEEGRNIFKKRHKARVLSLIEKVLQHKIFYQIFRLSLEIGDIPSKSIICKIMSESNLRINDTTIDRRRSTIRGWIEWIWKEIE